MLMTKFIGEPYAGKPHVRFDEGAGKEYVYSFSLYSTGKKNLTTKGHKGCH